MQPHRRHHHRRHLAPRDAFLAKTQHLRRLLRPKRQLMLKLRPDKLVPFGSLFVGEDRENAVHRTFHRWTKLTSAGSSFTTFFVSRWRSLKISWRGTTKST